MHDSLVHMSTCSSRFSWHSNLLAFDEEPLGTQHSNLCMVQFYLLPSPPGQPQGQVQPFGPGGGELFEAVLSRGRGAGQIENNFLLFPRSCAVRHFSVDAGPRGEDCLFPGRISRICSRLVREDNLSKLKSVFEGTFILNC